MYKVLTLTVKHNRPIAVLMLAVGSFCLHSIRSISDPMVQMIFAPFVFLAALNLAAAIYIELEKQEKSASPRQARFSLQDAVIGAIHASLSVAVIFSALYLYCYLLRWRAPDTTWTAWEALLFVAACFVWDGLRRKYRKSLTAIQRELVR